MVVIGESNVNMSLNTSTTLAAESPARSSGRLSWLPDFRPLQTISAAELMMLEDQLNQRLALDQEPEAESAQMALDLFTLEKEKIDWAGRQRRVRGRERRELRHRH